MANYTQQQNYIRALAGILPGAYSGWMLNAHQIHAAIIGAVAGYLIGFLIFNVWKIPKKLGCAFAGGLLANFVASIIRAAMELHAQSQSVMHQLGKFVMACIVVAVATFPIWIVSVIIFAVVDYVIGLAVKPSGESAPKEDTPSE